MSSRTELTFSARADAIDKEAGILAGVSMVTVGPVRGHGVYADQKTLETVRDCAATYSGGLKVKMEHGTDAKDIVGVLKSHRIEGQNLRADLQLLKNSPHYGHLVEMAETIPEAFGLSITFSGDYETIEIAEGLKVEAMRCREIYSCDVVDSPAANPGGLFMTKKETAEVPAGETKPNAGTLAAATFSVSPEQWAELERRVAAIEPSFGEVLDVLEDLKKQIPELIRGLAASMTDAELLALRRLGSMGIPAASVPAVSVAPPAPAPQKSFSEQLEAIPAAEITRRREFMKKHRAEIFAEIEAKRAPLVEAR